MGIFLCCDVAEQGCVAFGDAGAGSALEGRGAEVTVDVEHDIEDGAAFVVGVGGDDRAGDGQRGSDDLQHMDGVLGQGLDEKEQQVGEAGKMGREPLPVAEPTVAVDEIKGTEDERGRKDGMPQEEGDGPRGIDAAGEPVSQAARS